MGIMCISKLNGDQDNLLLFQATRQGTADIMETRSVPETRTSFHPI